MARVMGPTHGSCREAHIRPLKAGSLPVMHQFKACGRLARPPPCFVPAEARYQKSGCCRCTVLWQGRAQHAGAWGSAREPSEPTGGSESAQTLPSMLLLVQRGVRQWLE